VTAEALITRLVQEAPELDLGVIAELRDQLDRDGTPLALAISRVVALVGERQVDPAIALPALAEACATLAASRDPSALEAARYQIDTLLPVAERPASVITAPDVALDQVRRR